MTAGTVTGGNGTFTVTGNHTYADEGSEAASVTLTRSSDNANVTAAGNVTVGEDDVLTGHSVAAISAMSGVALNGVTVATFTDTDTANLASDFTATINWGDGSGATAGTVSGGNGTFTVTGSHTYTAAGSDTVSVTLSDDAPGTTTATANSTANIGQNDADVDEQAALSLKVGNTDVGLVAAFAVPFVVAGLDSEDSGTVTFTDGNGKVVRVSINGGQTRYTADLSTLADGTITSSLAVNTDPAGNSFTPVAGNAVTLDTDKGVAPILSFIGPVIDASADNAWPVTVSGLDDETGTLVLTDKAGHEVSVNITGNGTYSANLSSLSDGAIASDLSLSDPAGNRWNIAGAGLELVGKAATKSNYILLAASSAGNLGQVGTNAPTVIDAALTHGITFASGNGPDTIIAGSNDNVYAGDGPDTLIGANNATLHAGNGPQTLYGAPGETMFGGKGPDTFVFEPGFGHDTIVSFHTSNNVLQFSLVLLANFAAAMADTKQIGANSVITIDANDSVTLQNVNMSSLTANNFHFA